MRKIQKLFWLSTNLYNTNKLLGLQCINENLLNGQSNCTSDNFYEGSCSYICNDGYKITGNSVRKCVVNDNGMVTWNNDLPTCTG